MAIKGLMLGASVEVIDPGNSSQALVQGETSQTDGKFQLTIPASANFEGDYIKILVKGGAGATMICDAPAGCGAGTVLGDVVSIDDSVVLTSTLKAPADNETVNVNLTMFSTLASRFAETATGGLTDANLATADGKVTDVFDLGQVDIRAVNLLDVTVVPTDTPSAATYRMSLISGGFWGAAVDDGVAIGAALSALADAFATGDGTIIGSEAVDTAATSLDEILGKALELSDKSPIETDDFFTVENALIKDWVKAGEVRRDDEFAESNFFVDMVSDDTPDVLSGTITTQALQQAIDAASSETGGGIVQLSTGNYSFSEILMRSNVRLEIGSGTVITPTNRKLFSIAIANNSAQISNVEITTIDRTGRFSIDTRSFPVNGDIRPFQVGFVKNLSLSNFDVLDGFTKFSAIAFVPADDGQDPTNNPSFNNIPENVLVKNVSTFDTHYGYGMVQMQGGRNVLFKNIYSEGGATLRLETGSPSNGKSGPNTGGIHDIYADGVTNERGHTALHLSPHVKYNGKVIAKNLVSNDSGYVVQSQKGFNRDGVEGLPNGNFTPKPLIINAIATRTDGAQNATIKFKDFNALPDAERNGISYTALPDTPDEESKFFKPLAPITVLSATGFEKPGLIEDGFFGLIYDTETVDSYADTDPNTVEILFRRDGL
ncbi:glycoside hydrolase family protein [Robiginitomaculum antarcticum]|uniref:hypothetical protein n=1 Tax=Robiginitomaculum antarcticum TaxID=437507 RepID=UPI00037CBEF6|nr:hypothetical protein [Robiginitomaculum antarcticum]